MNVTDLKIGTRLEVDLLNKSGEKKGSTYVSQLLHVVDENNVIIASPIRESLVVSVSTGTHIRVISLHETHGLLSFTGVVKASRKKGNISMLLVNVVSKIKKIQRRKYYRLPCHISIQYCILENENENVLVQENANDENYKKAITKNLSASGICIVVDEKIPKDSFIRLTLPLGDNVIRVICKVVRSTQIESTKGKKYELGMYFVKLSQRHQDLIVKYIFDQQRELLKKELIDR